MTVRVKATPPTGERPIKPPPDPKPADQLAPPSTAVQASPPMASGAGTEVKALETRVNQFAVVAVADPEAYQRGADNLRTLKTLQDEARAKLDSFIKPLKLTEKNLRAEFAPIFEALEAADLAQRKALADYKTEQDRIEADKRRKAEAEARAERERLEAEARAREAEARKEAEEQRRKAEAARDAGQHALAERLAAKASATETKAEAVADNLRARAETVVAAPVATAAPKAKGLSDRVVWEFEILDAELLPRAFLMPDEAKIRKTVNALKRDAVAVLGGDKAVKITDRPDFSARRK